MEKTQTHVAGIFVNLPTGRVIQRCAVCGVLMADNPPGTPSVDVFNPMTKVRQFGDKFVSVAHEADDQADGCWHGDLPGFPQRVTV